MQKEWGSGTLPDVAVVVLNWDGIDYTRRCLNSLGQVNYPGRVEVVVVDNGSAGGEAARLAAEHPDATVLALPDNLGYGGGCNAGLAAARADGRSPYVLLLNNDATLEPDTLTDLVRFLEATPGAGAASPVIVFDDGATVWSAGGRVSVSTGSAIMTGKGTALNRLDRGPARAVEFAPGACLLLSRELPDALASLDPNYFAYWEDVDLCFRIRDSGLRCYVVTTATARHAKSASTGQTGDARFSPLVAYYLARNAFRFGRTHLSGTRRAYFLVSQLLLRAPFMLARRTTGSSRPAYLAGVRDGLLGRTGERRHGGAT